MSVHQGNNESDNSYVVDVMGEKIRLNSTLVSKSLANETLKDLVSRLNGIQKKMQDFTTSRALIRIAYVALLEHAMMESQLETGIKAVDKCEQRLETILNEVSFDFIAELQSAEVRLSDVENKMLHERATNVGVDNVANTHQGHSVNIDDEPLDAAVTDENK